MGSNKNKPVSEMPVMKACCKTCPFRLDDNGRYQDTELANTVISRNLFQSQQICHHPRIKGGKETHRCKGYYDYAFEIYDRMGLEPAKNLK